MPLSHCCLAPQVEALNDYSREWPSFKQVDGKWQFRKGFLEPFDDPKVVPFFFYRGLEALKYSWGERAFQVAVAAAYTGEVAAGGSNSGGQHVTGHVAMYVCLLAGVRGAPSVVEGVS